MAKRDTLTKFAIGAAFGILLSLSNISWLSWYNSIINQILTMIPATATSWAGSYATVIMSGLLMGIVGILALYKM